MLGIKYLNQAHLKGFDAYKYNSVDTSLLSVYVMHPFWNKCVQYFPRWLAPNLITFTGFLLTVLNFFIIAFYDYDFTAANTIPNPTPRWVWMVVAINLFLAYTLDGIDGKQARRTGTSSPLGELFDHGLDSYSTVLITVYLFSLFGTEDISQLHMFFLCWNSFLNFYLPHVEKYITGVMFLPWGYDFMMWGVTLTLALTAITGSDMWRTPMFGVQPASFFEILVYVSAVASSHPVIFWNIYKSYRDKTGKMRTFSEAFRPMIPLLSLFAITVYWVFLSVNDIVRLEPRLMFVACGTLFSNICCRLIVSQMSDTRADAWNFLLAPVILVVLLTTTPIYHLFGLRHISAATETMILYMLTALVTFAQLHYGQGVVREMCHHFKIKCFKVSRLSNAKTITANNNCSFSSNGKHVANDFYHNNLVILKSLQTKKRD